MIAQKNGSNSFATEPSPCSRNDPFPELLVRSVPTLPRVCSGTSHPVARHRPMAARRPLRPSTDIWGGRRPAKLEAGWGITRLDSHPMRGPTGRACGGRSRFLDGTGVRRRSVGRRDCREARDFRKPDGPPRSHPAPRSGAAARGGSSEKAARRGACAGKVRRGERGGLPSRALPHPLRARRP